MQAASVDAAPPDTRAGETASVSSTSALNQRRNVAQRRLASGPVRSDTSGRRPRRTSTSTGPPLAVCPPRRTLPNRAEREPFASRLDVASPTPETPHEPRAAGFHGATRLKQRSGKLGAETL